MFSIGTTGKCSPPTFFCDEDNVRWSVLRLLDWFVKSGEGRVEALIARTMTKQRDSRTSIQFFTRQKVTRGLLDQDLAAFDAWCDLSPLQEHISMYVTARSVVCCASELIHVMGSVFMHLLISCRRLFHPYSGVLTKTTLMRMTAEELASALWEIVDGYGNDRIRVSGKWLRHVLFGRQYLTRWPRARVMRLKMCLALADSWTSGRTCGYIAWHRHHAPVTAVVRKDPSRSHVDTWAMRTDTGRLTHSIKTLLRYIIITSSDRLSVRWVRWWARQWRTDSLRSYQSAARQRKKAPSSLRGYDFVNLLALPGRYLSNAIRFSAISLIWFCQLCIVSTFGEKLIANKSASGNVHIT